jgi:hypothetical protein
VLSRAAVAGLHAGLLLTQSRRVLQGRAGIEALPTRTDISFGDIGLISGDMLSQPVARNRQTKSGFGLVKPAAWIMIIAGLSALTPNRSLLKIGLRYGRNRSESL